MYRLGFYTLYSVTTYTFWYVFPFVYQFITCKWIVLQKNFSIIWTSFRNLFVVVVTWKCSFYAYSDSELIQTNKGRSFFQCQEVWQQSLVHISSQNFKIIQRYNASACMAYGRKEDFSTCKKGDQTWLLSNNARVRRHNGIKLFLNKHA